jgi:hypothetical protein
MKIGPAGFLAAGVFAAFAVAGCASLQPGQPTPNEIAAARSCKNQAPPTGSHLVDPKTCGTSGQAMTMSGAAFSTVMRQSTTASPTGQ